MREINNKIIQLSIQHPNHRLFSLAAFLLFIGILLAILTVFNMLVGFFIRKPVPMKIIGKHLIYAAACISLGTLGVHLS